MRSITFAWLSGLALLAACGGGSTSGFSTPPPQLTGIKPGFGDPAGGTAITLTGTGFAPGVTVTFGGAAATVGAVTATSIAVTTPAHAAGAADVTVTNPDGKSATRAAGFQYLLVPAPSSTTVRGLGRFPQALPLSGGLVPPFPGYSNVWQVLRDLSIDDWGGQLSVAAALWVGTPTGTPTADSLPLDAGLDRDLSTQPALAQAWADLSFTTPYVFPAEAPPVVTTSGFGAVVCATPPCAAMSGTLAQDGAGPVSGTTLRQAIDLTAVPAGVAFTLGWRQQVLVAGSDLAGAPAPSFVARILDGTGAPVWSSTPLGVGTTSGTASITLPDLPRGPVMLSFELLGSPNSFALLDDVSLTAGAAQLVVNGGFDPPAGLVAWVTDAPLAPAEVRGAPRELTPPGAPGALRVTRSFYTEPDLAWGRVVDVFENTAAAGTLTTDAVYRFALGAAGNAVLFTDVPGAAGRAFSGWDRRGVVGDVAVVHGGATAHVRSATAAGLGADDAFTLQQLSLGPGQKAAVVHFIVLGTTATGATAGTPLSTRPSGVDAVAAAIVAGWATDPRYQAYLTAEERALVVNF
ncbi:MAG TPA: IPT/TIG domain-containing protein [Anaeromyxobacteraceae bacterium]|nr:IPT/TIG domain-containing protein [Anaeromyxobacteraceae bacterium]